MRRLRPSTTYDAWFKLQTSTVVDDGEDNGLVRLRYRVDWNVTDLARIFRTVMTPPDIFVIPMLETVERARQTYAAAAYAASGNTPEDVFNMQVLKAHGYEGARAAAVTAPTRSFRSASLRRVIADPWRPTRA